MTITEADLAYLRNIDTRPGPNAGGAIDKRLPPYGPTPSSADVIEGMREALRPFAEYADKNRRLPADHIITQGSRFAKRQLTMGDCYRAADALALPDSRPDKGGA